MSELGELGEESLVAKWQSVTGDKRFITNVRSHSELFGLRSTVQKSRVSLEKSYEFVWVSYL